jgi:prohibitin 1
MGYTKIIIVFIAVIFSTSCTVIKPGEVGVKQKLGNLSEDYKTQGAMWFNPLVARVIVTNVQIRDIELSLSLPSKEGLSVEAQISILHRIDEKSVPKVIRDIGLRYEIS